MWRDLEKLESWFGWRKRRQQISLATLSRRKRGTGWNSRNQVMSGDFSHWVYSTRFNCFPLCSAVHDVKISDFVYLNVAKRRRKTFAIQLNSNFLSHQINPCRKNEPLPEHVQIDFLSLIKVFWNVNESLKLPTTTLATSLVKSKLLSNTYLSM